MAEVAEVDALMAVTMQRIKEFAVENMYHLKRRRFDLVCSTSLALQEMMDDAIDQVEKIRARYPNTEHRAHIDRAAKNLAYAYYRMELHLGKK